ncbi:hypothetical protein [Compostimonas suwonensis]|uniref:WxL domain-containing protein n=1 Tax=Compostimonas suwonensis TaxID=1048394 RepID=A0A2M9C360_9MICO|nr:hypothetical protein [Compostimonas suwonensis]PJJ64983.1 hypothetical protein CLV54_0008 [Compostimonas suwonensis]
MLKKNVARLAIVGLALAGLATVTTAPAFAAEANGSDTPVFPYNSADGTPFEADQAYTWTTEVFGSSSPTDPMVPFVCSDDAQTVQSFIAPRGQERTRASWSAWADIFFAPGTKTVLGFPISLYKNNLGNAAAVKAAGGEYSVGFACMKDNNVNFATSGVFFANVTIAPGGDYTVVPADVVVPPVDPTLTGDIDLEATTVAAENGVLSLEVPADAKATIGSPTLIDNLSTSTGDLPEVTVNDGRVLTREGWTLTSTVDDFTNATANATIEKKQLGVKPVLGDDSTSDGVVLGAEQIAGSADASILLATAPATTGVGVTHIGAELTFVAPADKPAGVYTSKMTLTLVSE